MTPEAQVNLLLAVVAQLNARGIQASFEHPGYVHANLGNDPQAEQFVAAGFEGEEFQLQIQDSSGRDSTNSQTLKPGFDSWDASKLIEMVWNRFTVEQVVERLGFRREHTGGGCEAYVRNIGGIEFMLTSDGDPSTPDRFDEPCTLSASWIGLDGETSNDHWIEGSQRNYPSVAAFIVKAGF